MTTILVASPTRLKIASTGTPQTRLSSGRTLAVVRAESEWSHLTSPPSLLRLAAAPFPKDDTEPTVPLDGIAAGQGTPIRICNIFLNLAKLNLSMQKSGQHPNQLRFA